MVKTAVIVRIIVWLVVAAVLIAVLAAGLAGYKVFKWDFNLFNINLGRYSYEDSGKYTAGNAELNASGLDSIDIDWVSGGVNITPYEGDTLKISESSNGHISAEEQLRWYYNGESLVIKFCAPRTKLSLGTLEKELTVFVPETIARDLENVNVNSVSAYVKLSGLECGSIRAETVSGESSFAGLNAAGLQSSTVSGSIKLKDAVIQNIMLESVSGGIDSENLSAGSVKAISNSGRIRIGGSVGSFKAETTSGRIILDSTICPKSIDAETVSGSIELLLPSDSSFTAELDSVSGSIEYDFMAKGGKNYIIVGDGSSEFRIESISGGLSIRQRDK
ncbi:MAG: DUF4097 family beta strand repeat-containing protein [Oscillospiraceae bacterium]|jgi:lia operon protein LiaG